MLSTQADRQYEIDPKFLQFRLQPFHTSLHCILQPRRAGMESPEVVRCADDQFHWITYSLGS